MKRIRIDGGSLSQESLTELLNSIHDRWFDIDHMNVRDGTKVVSLRLGQAKYGPYDRLLTIHGVEQIEIVDDARIGFYDLNKIRIDSEPTRLMLTSGFPLTVTMDLSNDWEITVADT